MIRFTRGAIAAAAAVVALAAISSAASAAATPQDSVQSLVGTWSCVTHSSDNTTSKDTDVDAMYGKWLKIDSTFGAGGGQAAGTSHAFFGYDGKAKRWIFTGVDSNGNYFMNYSGSPAFNGSQWSDGFPNNHGSAVVHMTNTTQYIVDSKGPGAGGKTVTSHEVCTRG